MPKYYLKKSPRPFPSKSFPIIVNQLPALHAGSLIIHSLVFNLTGRVGSNQSPVMWPVWL